MKRIWGMVLDEPYRIFFPLGILAALWGVLMWPMLYAGQLNFYPGEAHSRMMIEGFLGAFILGFIGTAFPRLTGNRSWSGAEFGVLLLMWALTVTSHAVGRVAAGDCAFSALLAVAGGGMVARWVHGHRDTPPPGFVLAIAGILGAAVATGFLAGSHPPSGSQLAWERLWLFQGFPLLPLLGIGPYLLPRFFGMTSSHSFDASLTPPAGWWPRALAAMTAGLAITLSFALEVGGLAMAGHLLRAAVIGVWFAVETPACRRTTRATTPGNAIRWAILALTAGCGCAAVWPLARIGSMHLFFAAGLGCATLAAGARIVLGHANRHDLLAGKIVWLRWVIGLFVLAAATRMSADFLPSVRSSHHIYAACAWALGALCWLAAMMKYFLRNDDPGKPASKCPRRSGRPLPPSTD